MIQFGHVVVLAFYTVVEFQNSATAMPNNTKSVFNYSYNDTVPDCGSQTMTKMQQTAILGGYHVVFPHFVV